MKKGGILSLVLKRELSRLLWCGKEFIMAENNGCTHDCSSCGADCASRKPESLLVPQNAGSNVKKVIGIVSGIDKPDANVERVTRWLKLAGCKRIFPVSAVTGEGLSDIIAYLNEDEEKTTQRKASDS